MAQKEVMINRKKIWQPDSPMQWNFEVTYTPDSTRPQNGTGHFTVMFVTHSLSYVGTYIPAADTAEILQMIVGKQYEITAFNPYMGKWVTDVCYTGKGDLGIKTLREGGEMVNNLSFNAVYVNPLILVE